MRFNPAHLPLVIGGTRLEFQRTAAYVRHAAARQSAALRRLEVALVQDGIDAALMSEWSQSGRRPRERVEVFEESCEIACNYFLALGARNRARGAA